MFWRKWWRDCTESGGTLLTNTGFRRDVHELMFWCTFRCKLFVLNYVVIITQHAVTFQPFVTSSYERDETIRLASRFPHTRAVAQITRRSVKLWLLITEVDFFRDLRNETSSVTNCTSSFHKTFQFYYNTLQFILRFRRLFHTVISYCYSHSHLLRAT